MRCLLDPRPEPVVVLGSVPQPAEPLLPLAPAPAPGPRPAAPVPAGVAALTRALVETLGGHRAASQLARWATEPVLAELRCHASRTRVSTAVRSLRVQEPRPGVAEVAVHLTVGRRPRAAALRLEAHHERWLVTALELGPRVAA